MNNHKHDTRFCPLKRIPDLQRLIPHNAQPLRVIRVELFYLLGTLHVSRLFLPLDIGGQRRAVLITPPNLYLKHNQALWDEAGERNHKYRIIYTYWD